MEAVRGWVWIFSGIAQFSSCKGLRFEKFELWLYKFWWRDVSRVRPESGRSDLSSLCCHLMDFLR